MLNAADLMLLATLLAGPACGLAAALLHRAPFFPAACLVLAGVVLGVAMGFGAHRLADSVLASKRWPPLLQFLLYLCLPLLGLACVATAPFLLARALA